MREPPAGKVLTTDLRDHPAVRAWAGCRPARVEPDRLEVLKGRAGTAKRSAYRLVGVGPGGSAVIAKRTRQFKAAVERTVYEEVLPHVPGPTPRYFGCVEEPDGKYGWLFVEDVGPGQYSTAREDHRRLAGRWLGLLHTAAARVPAADRLPDQGPAQYLGRLHQARDRIRAGLGNPALTAADREVLGAVLAQGVALEGRWAEIEAACAGMPRTLVHGDFVPKNVRVRAGEGGPVLLPFDWGNSGWGVPAVDLARDPFATGGLAAGPDLGAYWEVAREHWPGLDLPAVERWADLGTMFRGLVALSWEARDLTHEWVELPMARVRLYQAVVTHALRAAGWEG